MNDTRVPAADEYIVWGAPVPVYVKRGELPPFLIDAMQYWPHSAAIARFQLAKDAEGRFYYNHQEHLVGVTEV